MTQSECNTPLGLRVTAIYLGITSIAAVVAAPAYPRGVPWLAAHIVALLICVTLVRRPRPRALAGWLPLLAVPFLYAELPFLMAAFGSAYRDAAVQHWEILLFSASPAATLAGRFPSLALSELLHAGYLSYYPMIYLTPLVLYRRREYKAFETNVLALSVVFTVCFAIFVVFPVAGPRYLWPAPTGVPDGPVRQLVLVLVHAGSSRGTAFPSSHVAVATVQAVMTLYALPRLGAVVSALTVLLSLGAVYGGFHYGVDAVAGAILGGLVAGGVLLTVKVPGPDTNRRQGSDPECILPSPPAVTD